ncbi:SPRY domain [Carpediemonas membranifera]|uniref:SPRY domain n=1 Tax=Carpediemonas membranifera TaxID=201153 RepID=A0A8J6AW94_9EUKA|nr:SPRY domain [Carpediemonas membranifera]|eukprot:KAG9393150.1 SPRY domain [Carpediemonas membranifera]
MNQSRFLLVSRYIRATSHSYSLPSRMIEQDDMKTDPKWRIDKTGLSCVYVFPAEGDSDACIVRSDNPIPSMVGIYYFEVTIREQGQDGFIGVGLCARSTHKNKLPGWEPRSVGFHSDDGSLFMGSGETHRHLGQPYRAGDIVGLLVNFALGTIQFTVNGSKVADPLAMDFGAYFKGPCFPCVGTRSLNVAVDVNFGKTGFVFDFDSEVQDTIHTLRTRINAVNVLPPSSRGGANTATNKAHFTKQMVLSHLMYRGMPKSAAALATRVYGGVPESVADAESRFPPLGQSLRAMNDTIEARAGIRAMVDVGQLLQASTDVLESIGEVDGRKLRRLVTTAQFLLLAEHGTREQAFAYAAGDLRESLVPEFEDDFNRYVAQLIPVPGVHTSIAEVAEQLAEELNRVLVASRGGSRSVLEVALLQLILILWSCSSTAVGTNHGVLLQINLSASRTFGILQVPVDRRVKADR